MRGVVVAFFLLLFLGCAAVSVGSFAGGEPGAGLTFGIVSLGCLAMTMLVASEPRNGS